LKRNTDGSYSLIACASLGVKDTLCTSEKFICQPALGYCTCFAISPDYFVTAGHCILGFDLQDIAIVYGYQMIDSVNFNTTFSVDDVFFPVSIVDAKNSNDDDYAVFRADKKIPENKVLKIRRSGKINNDAKLYVCGYPSGLPLKIATNGKVKINNFEKYFITNLDTYGGNSGSPVFNTGTNEVEGILLEGCVDFIKINIKGCYESYRWKTSDTCQGEKVLRTSVFCKNITLTKDNQ
jgi:hypothetical protein